MTMLPDVASQVLANMSAPPRSSVMLPRLALTPRQADGSEAPATAVRSDVGAPELGSDIDREGPARKRLPVGPLGGVVLSNAMCIVRVDLPTALCSYLDIGYGDGTVIAPLGLARALVAVARTAHGGRTRPTRAAAAKSELARVTGLSEADLVSELAEQLQSVPWPTWAPPIGFAQYLAIDAAIGIDRSMPPPPPSAVRCPLLTARVIAGIRGTVFVRDAAPTLANLLTLWDGSTPSGVWEIWMPIRPGQIEPQLHTPESETDE